MQKIELSKKNITVGIEWSALVIDTSVRRAIKTHLEENPDIKQGIIIKGEEETMIGAIPADEKMVAPSGAALLTAANKKQNARLLKEDSAFSTTNWVVVQSVPGMDDQYWVVVIERGIPTADSDMIGSYSEVLRTIKDVSDSQEAGSFILYCDVPEICEEIKQSDAIEVELRDFGSLVKGVPVRYKPRQLKGMDPKILYVVFGVLVLGVGAYLYNDWSSEQEMLEVQNRAHQQQQQTEQQKLKAQAEYEAQKKQVVEQSIKEAKDGLNTLISKGMPKATLNAWSDIIDKVPMAHDGWKLVSVECVINESIPSCVVNLDRGEIGINRTLMQDFPDVNITGDKANYVLTGNSLSFPKRNFENLPNVRYFKMEAQTKLQEVKFADVKHAFEASNEITKDIVLPQPPVGVTQDTNIEPIRMGVSTGPFHVEGTGLWQLRGLASVMDDPTMGLKSLSITFNADDLKITAWKLEADYFVKVADEPTIPTIPPSKTVVGG